MNLFSFRLFYFKVFVFIRKCFSDKVMSNNSITVDKQAVYSNYGGYGGWQRCSFRQYNQYQRYIHCLCRFFWLVYRSLCSA